MKDEELIEVWALAILNGLYSQNTGGGKIPSFTLHEMEAIAKMAFEQAKIMLEVRKKLFTKSAE